MIQFTKFSHSDICGKIFEINQQTGKFEKRTIGNLKAANIETITLNNISEFPTYLAGLNGHNHSTAGVSPINASMAIKGPVNYPNGVINRSNKDLPFSEHAQALFCIDDDDSAGGGFPQIAAFKEHACVRYTSSGSNIVSEDGKVEFRGFNGSHTFYAVKDGTCIKKAMERLHKREILNYRGKCKVSEAGTFLERSCIDRMLASPSQPIYHKATCLTGLKQNQIVEYIPGILEPIDLKKVVKPLSKEEEAQYLTALEMYEDMLRPEMERVREVWINARADEGISRENATKALDNRALEHDFIIHTKQGDVSVGDILADPLRWNKVTCSDPIEPSYNGGSMTVAKIFSFQNRPMINSNCHGGITYSLHDATAVGFDASPPVTIEGATGEVIEQPAAPPQILPEGALYRMDISIDHLKWTANQVKGSTNDVMSTIHNFKLMMHYYGINVAYDLIGKDILMTGPNMSGEGDMKDAANIGWINHLCELNKFKVSTVSDNLNVMMNDNQINPVRDWITEYQWDGVDRIKELFETLTLAEGQEPTIAYMMFRKWFIGACRIGLGEIPRFEFVLCLQESEGGAGKTRWFNKLCPDVWQSDGVIFDPTDKDSVKQVISYWLNELGELDSTFKSDVKKTMAFLTKNEDEIRLPYASKSAKFGRRTAFFGSVNKKNFLLDDSGDRRFWPISVSSINYTHEINMQQFWAQINEIPDSEHHWLDPAENARIIAGNKEFKSLDVVDDMLSSYFEGSELTKMGGYTADGQPIIVPADMEHLSVTEVLIKAGIERPTQANLNKASMWLKDNNFKPQRSNKKRGFFVTTISKF